MTEQDSFIDLAHQMSLPLDYQKLNVPFDFYNAEFRGLDWNEVKCPFDDRFFTSKAAMLRYRRTFYFRKRAPKGGSVDLDAAIAEAELDELNRVKKVVRAHHSLSMCEMSDGALKWMTLPPGHSASNEYQRTLASIAASESSMRGGMVVVTEQNKDIFFSSPFVFDKSFAEAMGAEIEQAAAVPPLSSVPPIEPAQEPSNPIAELLGIPANLRCHKFLFEDCDALKAEGRDIMIRFLSGKYKPAKQQIVILSKEYAEGGMWKRRRVFKMLQRDDMKWAFSICTQTNGKYKPASSA